MHHMLMYETKCSKLYHAKSHTCIPSSVANMCHDPLNTDVRNVVYLQQWIEDYHSVQPHCTPTYVESA